MNKKVFVSMLCLTVTLLIGYYIAKVAFAQDFALVVSNPRVISFGMYVDTHWWARYLCNTITCFITYYLYIGICKCKFGLNKIELICIVAFSIALNPIYDYMPDWGQSCFFLSLLFLMTIDPKSSSIKRLFVAYGIDMVNSYLSLTIRDLVIHLSESNYATNLLMTIESYLWLVLIYTIYNYKENKHGRGQTSILR